MSEELYDPNPEVMLNNVKRYLYEYMHNEYSEALNALFEISKKDDTSLEAYEEKIKLVQKAGKAVAAMIVSDKYKKLSPQKQAGKIYALTQKPEVALKKYLAPLVEDEDDMLVQRWYQVFMWYAPHLSKQDMLKLMFMKNV